VSEEPAGAENGSQRPAGPLEYRDAKQIGVSFPKRTIELVVVPYDEHAVVEHHGRMITESIAPGAFDGIERRPNRIRVLRDHDNSRVVGRATALHPSRKEGLVAELRIAKTELGEETLTLADDDMLDASAAFLPMPGGEQWPNQSERRLTKLYLGHVAMTPDPAFAGAKVLSVRSSGEPAGATPNADLVRSWLLADAYAKLGDSR
jgi:HK97 family phage prohead protease